jgi:hypothetical protein
MWTTPAGEKLLITARVTGGQFAISPVPAGKYRLVAVKTDAVPSRIDAAFLAPLWAGALPVSYALAERKTIDLVVSSDAITRIVNATGSSLMQNPATIGPRTIVPGAPAGAPMPTAPQGPGVISGIVTDADGRPVAGAQIQILRRVMLNNVPQLGAYGPPALTDANGAYRITGVPIGPALIAALAYPFAVVPGTPQPTLMPPATVASDGTKLGYVTTFFPGVAEQARARSITVGEGEISQIDFSLARVPVADVTGRISGMDPNVRTTAPLFVLPAAMIDQVAGRNVQRVPVNPDGTFTLKEIAFGNYTLIYNGPNGWLREPLTVSGNLAASLSLKLSPFLSVSGRLEFKGERPSVTPAELTQFDVRLNTAPLGAGSPLLRAQIQPTGEFTISRVPAGRYVLQVASPAPWIEISGALNGRDTLDFPVDLAADSKDAVVTFVDRETAIRGFVRNAQGAGVTDGIVMIFSSDSQHWTPGSRRVRTTRALPGGTFTIAGLPPGQYFAIALEKPPAALSPALFQRLAERAFRFDLLIGQMRTIDLVVETISAVVLPFS